MVSDFARPLEFKKFSDLVHHIFNSILTTIAAIAKKNLSSIKNKPVYGQICDEASE